MPIYYRMKMQKAVTWTNNYSGLLSFISFLGLILFWIFGMQASVEGLASDHAQDRAAQKEVVNVLLEIRDSLKDRGTDHVLFNSRLDIMTTQLNVNTASTNKISEAVIRISYALDNIDKRFERSKTN